MTDASREAFEAWARDERMTTGGLRGADNWCLWQAAVAWATAQHGDSHIGTGHPESVAGPGVDADSRPSSAQPEPPADLVERAHVAFAEKYPLTAASSPEMYRFAAAFAAEYAAEMVEKTDERVGFAEHDLSRAVEDIKALTARAEAAEKALAEEREACAKVAETNSLPYPTYATEWVLQGRVEAGRSIAAAIRARKGGGMLKTKEHYDLMAEFEKRKHGRLDKEDQRFWPIGRIYQDGHVNNLFLAFRDGYTLGRAVERMEGDAHD